MLFKKSCGQQCLFVINVTCLHFCQFTFIHQSQGHFLMFMRCNVLQLGMGNLNGQEQMCRRRLFVGMSAVQVRYNVRPRTLTWDTQDYLLGSVEVTVNLLSQRYDFRGLYVLSGKAVSILNIRPSSQFLPNTCDMSKNTAVHFLHFSIFNRSSYFRCISIHMLNGFVVFAKAQLMGCVHSG